MKHCITFGNDYYQPVEELVNEETIIGIGKNCHFENCIIDKDVKIGNNVVIIGKDSMQDLETEHYCVKEGIVIIKKGANILSGTRVE